MPIEAVKEHLTLVQIAQKFNVHPSQIKKWKQVLLEENDILFEHGNSKQHAHKDSEKTHDNLLRIIGKLQVENEFLKKRSTDATGIKDTKHRPLKGAGPFPAVHVAWHKQGAFLLPARPGMPAEPLHHAFDGRPGASHRQCIYRKALEDS